MTNTNYFFTDYTEGTRTGFKHVSALIYGGLVVGRATCRYINRTWEAYRYRSSRSAAVEAAMESIEAQQLQGYKEAHGYERMTQKRLDVFHQWLAQTFSAYADYQQIYEQL